MWRYATAEERAEIAQNLSSAVRVRVQSIVSAKLAHDEYLPLVASAEGRNEVGMARPEGSQSAVQTLVGEGVDELVGLLAA